MTRLSGGFHQSSDSSGPPAERGRDPADEAGDRAVAAIVRAGRARAVSWANLAKQTGRCEGPAAAGGRAVVMRASGRKPVLREADGRVVDIRPSCLDKARQPDEAVARAVAMHMLSAGLAGAARRAWVYPCRWCRGWHITTTFRPGNGAAVTAANPWVAESSSRPNARAGGRSLHEGEA